jgi:hypothetical protein
MFTRKTAAWSRLTLGLAAFVCSTGVALAQTAATSGTGNSIGEKLQAALQTSAGPIFIVIAGLAWLSGLFLFFSGLGKLAQAGQSQGHNEGFSSGLAKLVAGILLFALPDFAGIGVTSMFGSNAGGIFAGGGDLAQISQQLDLDSNGGGGALSSGQSLMQAAVNLAGKPVPPEDCYSSALGVTCMAKNIAKNAVPIGIFAIYIICFLAGLSMLASVLWTASKSMGGGHQQGLPPGFWMKAAVAVLLINSPFLIQAVATTISGQQGVLSINGFDADSSFLSYKFKATQGQTNFSDQMQRFAELIGYVFVILAFFGVWAFFKGVFLVKSSAEGKSQGGMGGGFVFMVGGALLANAKISTCMIMYTFGGNGMTFGFCG